MEGLRPLGVGELLDASIRIYKGRAKTLLAAVAIPVIPVVIFTTLITWSSQPGQQTDPSTGLATEDGGDLGLMFAGLIVSLLVTVVASSVATAACYRSISGAYVGDDPDWRESLRFGLSRIWPVLALSFVTSLLTGFGLIFCLVGALVPYTFFSVACRCCWLRGREFFGLRCDSGSRWVGDAGQSAGLSVIPARKEAKLEKLAFQSTRWKTWRRFFTGFHLIK